MRQLCVCRASCVAAEPWRPAVWLPALWGVAAPALPFLQGTIDRCNRSATRTLTSGEIGIQHSNVAAWRLAVERGWEWCLVLEDDATFLDTAAWSGGRRRGRRFSGQGGQRGRRRHPFVHPARRRPGGTGNGGNQLDVYGWIGR